jgi:hypothetical protein
MELGSICELREPQDTVCVQSAYPLHLGRRSMRCVRFMSDSSGHCCQHCCQTTRRWPRVASHLVTSPDSRGLRGPRLRPPHHRRSPIPSPPGQVSNPPYSWAPAPRTVRTLGEEHSGVFRCNSQAHTTDRTSVSGASQDGARTGDHDEPYGFDRMPRLAATSPVQHPPVRAPARVPQPRS